MALVSAIPKNTWLPTGLTTPDEPDIFAGVVADLQTAFGGNLNLDVATPSSYETPQGQLAQSITQIKGEINDNILFLSSQINPRYASGIWQDALAWLYFITRKPALPTSVQVVCSGLDGAIIPIGAKVQDTSGNIYQAVEQGIISDGTVTVTFENVTPGATPCLANTVTRIYQTVVGWDSCNNPDPGTTGQDVESQQQLEERRYASVANNAHGTLASLYGAVFELEGVIDVYVTENTTSSPLVITGYSLAPYSVYIAAVGGVSADIAQAIFNKKPAGVAMNGNTSVTVTDKSGYNYPFPSYTILFERPAALPIKFALDIVDDPLLPSDVTAQIKDAIIESFNGEDGGTRARIGNKIVANRFVQNIYKKIPSIQVLDINIGTVTATLNIVTVPIDKTPTINAANITINYI